MSRKMTPFEIWRRTPKTNCGQCGYPACLAWAAAVATAGADPASCPFFNHQGFVGPQVSAGPEDSLQAWQLVRQLQDKIAPLAFDRLAPRLGADWQADHPDQLRFVYLGQQACLAKDGLLLDGSQPMDPRDLILLCNYVHQGGGRPPAADWIGMESLPNSISKVITLAVYAEERLASLLTSTPPDYLLRLAFPLQGREEPVTGTSASVVVPVLPMVPLLLLFWEAEEEFAPRVKILFDRGVLDFLDLESLVFAAERLTDRLLARSLEPGPAATGSPEAG